MTRNSILWLNLFDMNMNFKTKTIPNIPDLIPNDNLTAKISEAYIFVLGLVGSRKPNLHLFCPLSKSYLMLYHT